MTVRSHGVATLAETETDHARGAERVRPYEGSHAAHELGPVTEGLAREGEPYTKEDR